MLSLVEAVPQTQALTVQVLASFQNRITMLSTVSRTPSVKGAKQRKGYFSSHCVSSPALLLVEVRLSSTCCSEDQLPALKLTLGKVTQT